MTRKGPYLLPSKGYQVRNGAAVTALQYEDVFLLDT